MSKIKLTGESSGYVEISAGNAAGNNTLEAPTSGTRLVAHEGSQDVTLNGNLTVNGVVSYEDVTNIDSVGIMTARNGLHVTGGSVGIGTITPGSALEIRTTTTNAATHYRNNASNGGAYFGVRATDLGAASAGEAYVYSYNTGINLLADGTGHIDFATGGTASKVRITSAGNIGIDGTTSPRAKFDFGSGTGNGTLNQTISNYQAVFESPQGTGNYSRNIGFAVGTNGIGAAINAVDNGANDATGLIFATGTAGSIAERLRITSAGGVGIGTDNPYARNHIEIDVNAGAGNGSAAALWLKNANQTANNSATIFFGNNVSQAAGAINFIHKDYSTNSGDITFDTRADGSTYAERLRIRSNSQLLHTRTDNTTRYDLEFRNTGGISDGNYGGIHWTQGSTGSTNLAAIEIEYANTGRPAIVFKNRQSGGAAISEAVRIDSGARFGVQTSEPKGKIHIGGSIGSDSNDADTAHTSLIIKQTNNDNKSGLYIERSGERKGYYMWMNPGGGSGDALTFTRNNAGTKSNALILDRDANLWGGGHFYPLSDDSYDLGSASNRWRNVYTTDLQLSNEGSQNDVDGTWGSYTIQEGEDELFLINRRNGKKYKFNLTEVN